MRLYFQNINGRLKEAGWAEYEEAMKKLKDLQVDVFGFAEKNLPWGPQDIYTVKAKTRQHNKGIVRVQTSASDAPSVTSYQPGEQ
eukprot:13192506-Ditylum_brightwellii.AAC.1